MTKSEALTLLQCNIRELAKMLDISPVAVTKWRNDCIPLAREYQIRDLLAGRQPLQDSRNKASATSEIDQTAT